MTLPVTIRGLPDDLLRRNEAVLTQMAQEASLLRVALPFGPRVEVVNMAARRWCNDEERTEWLVVEPATDADRAAIARWTQAQQ
jgi:hypothetical protein